MGMNKRISQGLGLLVIALTCGLLAVLLGDVPNAPTLLGLVMLGTGAGGLVLLVDGLLRPDQTKSSPGVKSN